ncbi:MAG: hypothetical protein OEM62_04550 [Acidobacteriota bacterium]|nr:hypothetical protein [Acidobacteriota bacterium]
MRARLLDMGEVGPIRAYSIPHAVTAGLDHASEPALILISPASPVVSLDQTTGAPLEIDLGLCAEHGIPVVRRRGGLGTTLVGPGHLLLALSVPRSRAAEIGVSEDAEELAERFGQAIVAALLALGAGTVASSSGRVEIGGREVAHVHVLALNEGLCCLAGLAIETDNGLATSVLQEPMTDATALRQTIIPPPDPHTVAEAAVSALESHFGLELFPSMPQPHEMEAIYDWDLRLHENGEIDQQTAAGVAG